MKKIFIFLMLCCLSVGAFAQTKAKAVKAPGDTVDCISFIAAVDTLNKYDGGTVLVCADDANDGPVYIKKKITILPYQNGNYTITRNNSYSRSMFSIESSTGAELIIGNESPTDGGSLTFSGNSVNTNPTALFYIKNKTIFRNNVFLKYNYAASSTETDQAGAIVISANGSDGGGSFKGELHITGNTAIESNYTTHNAPIIRVTQNGKFYMEDGVITGNESPLSSLITGEGANSIIEITGGKIESNTYKHDADNAAIKTAAASYSLGSSATIKDTIMGDKQINVSSNLTNHSATNPIIVKVNYTTDRQLLTGDAAVIAANYMKFKPVDVNGKQVKIKEDGMLTCTWPMYSVKAGTTDTLGHLTLKAAVEYLNANGGGTVLADSNETLTQTVVVNSDITLLPYHSDKTFTRGDTMKHKTSPLIRVKPGASLTIGNAANEAYSTTFDGANLNVSNAFAVLFENNGTLSLAGKVIMQNNNAGYKTISGSAIYNSDSLDISGNATFANNFSNQYSGAIHNDNNSKMNISGDVSFIDNGSRLSGGAISFKNGSKSNITESATVVFNGNKSNNGGALDVSFGAKLTIDGNVNFQKNVAIKGATLSNGGTTNINGMITVVGDTSYNSGVITSGGTLNIKNSEIKENVLYIDSTDFNNGTIVVEHNSTVLVGGNVHNNIFINRTGTELHPLPASVVITSTGNQSVTLGDSVIIDTMTLVIANGFNQKVILNSNLTAVSESNPIVLQLDSLDKQVIDRTWISGASDNGTRIANNYKKFKVACDTLSINNKGWVVRTPEISIDTVILLQAGTNYENYGITDSTGLFLDDQIYVRYSTNVDAHGSSTANRADSVTLKLDIAFEGGAPVTYTKKVSNIDNGTHSIVFGWGTLSEGGIQRGTYTMDVDTMAVHTLGVAAGTSKEMTKFVNIPTVTIDTLNFLLAGTRFSDYHHCGVGATTNDGDGADVVPGNEIYVQYQREGAIDTASVMVAIKGNNQMLMYKESTPAGTHLAAGCGSFRSFLDNSGIGKFVETADPSTETPLTLADDSTYTYFVTVKVKADGDPYFSLGIFGGPLAIKQYTHNIDRATTFALDTANNRNVNYNNIGITLTNTNDSLALNYPSAFSVAKARELGMVDNTDNCVYVVLTADPVDTTIRVESANNAKSLGTDLALNSTNYSTTGYGIQDGKLLMAVKVSAPIQTNDVVVPALNFSKDSVLRWCSVIGEITGIDNPYKTFRTFYKVSGKTANDTTVVAASQMTYRSTGVSGVKLHASNGQASYMFHPEDYTVWPSQDPTPGLTLDGKVWLALYVAAPNTNVKKVYNPALNTPYSTNTDSIVTLQDALAKRVTTTEAVNYYPVGTCANYATKDYTFYHTGDAPYNNNYLYWFDENSKLLSVQKYNVAVKKAPIYTVNYNFNGGGATCNTPYAAGFADTTYIFGRKISRPADPFKCGHLFMDWYEGTSQFLTVDSFKNVRNGNTGIDTFGIRANHNLNATWRYFVTLNNPHDTAVVADYSLCQINVRDYVWEPTETTFPYVYTFHTDYLGNYYRDYLATGNANCNVRFDANAFTENPTVLPVGQTSHVTWSVTDMCGTPFTIGQDINVKFPPCGTDNYNPHLYPFTPYVDSTYKAKDYEGNLYETVRMGCDCWTKENLKSLEYVDGTSIPVAKAYFNDEANVDVFGRLYTWYSAVRLPEGATEVTVPLNADSKPQGVCPTGWYLPSNEDFARMSNLGNIQGSAAGIKTDGSNNYWLGHETGNNATGFSAIPAGYYDYSTNSFYNLLGDTYFWSSSSTSTISAPCCSLTHNCPRILLIDNNKYYGYSIRCIKYKKFDY